MPHHRVFDEAFWDDRYRSAPAVWSGNPNPHLVTDSAPLPPGRALDVGCGEGADALWLASRGGTVTATDLPQVALDRAAAPAADAGRRVDWLRRDVLESGPAEGAFDLVSCHFLHLPSAVRGPAFARLAVGVATGGSLLLTRAVAEPPGRP